MAKVIMKKGRTLMLLLSINFIFLYRNKFTDKTRIITAENISNNRPAVNFVHKLLVKKTLSVNT